MNKPKDLNGLREIVALPFKMMFIHEVEKGNLAISKFSQNNVVQAFEMAMSKQRDRASFMIHHSDRGSQYCPELYQSALSKHGVLSSMTDGFLAK